MKGKISLLEAKLNAKMDELDRVKATRSEWPDAQMEKQVVMLSDKVRVDTRVGIQLI